MSIRAQASGLGEEAGGLKPIALCGSQGVPRMCGMCTSVLNALRRYSTASTGVQTPSSTRASMPLSNAVSSGDIVAQRRGVTLSGHATTRPDHETTEVVA